MTSLLLVSLLAAPPVVTPTRGGILGRPAARDDLVAFDSTVLGSMELVSGSAIEGSTLAALNDGKTYLAPPQAAVDGGRAFVPSDGAAVVFNLPGGHPIYAVAVVAGGAPARAAQRFKLEAAPPGGGFAMVVEVDLDSQGEDELGVLLTGDAEQSEALIDSAERLRFTFQALPGDAATAYREIDVFSTPAGSCPAAGDTDCIDTEVIGPADRGPGEYTVRATAIDGSAGDIAYWFRLHRTDGLDPAFPGIAFQTDWQLEPEVSFTLPDLRDGTWSVQILVDDDLECADETPLRFCSGTQIIIDPIELGRQAMPGGSLSAVECDLAASSSPALLAAELTAGAALEGSSPLALNDGTLYAGSSPGEATGLAGFVPGAGSSLTLRFDLGASPGGYNVESIAVATGSNSARLAQRYTVHVETAGSPGDFALLEAVSEPGPASGELRVTLERSPQLLAAAVSALRFDFEGPAGGELAAVYREIDVVGLAAASGLPPSCGDARRFRRSDANGDGGVDVSDAVATFVALFLGGAAPDCPDAADANDDGRVDISDGIATLNHLFLGRASPPAPFPDCGVDPTADALGECRTAAAACP